MKKHSVFLILFLAILINTGVTLFGENIIDYRINKALQLVDRHGFSVAGFSSTLSPSIALTH